jgi:hypothetical protein
MKAKKIILAAFAGTALLAAAGAQARDGWAQIHRDTFHRGHSNHGHYGNGHYRHYAPRVVVRPAYRPYYRPAPVYYAPPPAYYYGPRAPVVYGQIPLGHHSSIGFSLPLGY